MQTFILARRNARLVVAICESLDIRTRVWYGQGRERLDIYASGDDARAALEMSGAKVSA